MEKCRSGHNGTDSKSVLLRKLGPWVRIPPSPPNGGKMRDFFKARLSAFIAFGIVLIALLFTIFFMVRYEFEGEKNMPFEVEKILVISGADASEKETNEANMKWNVDINQFNDIYVLFKKNDANNKGERISEVRIENLTIKNAPKKGEIKMYKPSEDENKKFDYGENSAVDGKLVFTGDDETKNSSLKINRDGGTVKVRIANTKVGEYVSNEGEEINYDGTLIAKTDSTLEDLKADIQFDIVLVTDKLTYRATITTEIPVGNIVESGVSQKNIDVKNIVFKRE